MEVHNKFIFTKRKKKIIRNLSKQPSLYTEKNYKDVPLNRYKEWILKESARVALIDGIMPEYVYKLPLFLARCFVSCVFNRFSCSQPMETVMQNYEKQFIILDMMLSTIRKMYLKEDF
jgi:hypothetical protein